MEKTQETNVSVLFNKGIKGTHNLARQKENGRGLTHSPEHEAVFLFFAANSCDILSAKTGNP